MMSNVDFGRYKKIVKLFWDPEPQNDEPSQSSIWLLGREYSARPASRDRGAASVQQKEESEAPVKEEGSYIAPERTLNVSVNGGRETAPSRTREEEAEGGWPKEFLDDFESRPWMTYRSNFSAIKKSTDPKASASISFSVRLRSQLDQGGFTSDTGWGCMIRSGQSVLANALVMLRLGRGHGSTLTPESMALTRT
jgi:cysteine protease ATG4